MIKKKNYVMMIKWSGNKIGVEGAIKISELLTKNTTLTQLYLFGGIEEEGKIIKGNKK